MPQITHLSESSPNFTPHTTLLDKPYLFETTQVKGCVFYLSPEKGLGGDSFIVYGEDHLSVGLLADMQGHGQTGRDKWLRYPDTLEQLISEVRHSDDDCAVITYLQKLDSILNPVENAIALTLMNYRKNGLIGYINCGENTIVFQKNDGKLKTPAHTSPKLGYNKLIQYSIDKSNQFLLKKQPIKKHNRIFIFSDGVTDLLSNHTSDDNLIMDRLKNILQKKESLEENMCKINEYLHRKIFGNPRIIHDDYTILAVEIK